MSVTVKLPLHGGQLQQIAKYLGIPAEGLLDFSANINPDGPPVGVYAALRQALDDPAVLTTYPELKEAALRSAIAAYAGVEPDNIAVANGFVPLLDATLRAMSVRQCRLSVPAFTEYRRTLTNSSVAIIPERLAPESNFRYDIESMLKGSPDAILIANPQNPTGVLHDRETLLDLTHRAAAQGTLILLDEAFIDYCSEVSLASDVERHSNLVVFRSVTKFFGMPGLRVAYAISCGDTIARIQEHIGPWSITTLASRAVARALADRDYIRQATRLNERRRNWLVDEMRNLSLRVEPASANFVLFLLPAGIDPGAFWKHMIEDHRLVLRWCKDFESLPEGYLRASVRSDSDNYKLIEALRRTLVLFEARGKVTAVRRQKAKREHGTLKSLRCR